MMLEESARRVARAQIPLTAAAHATGYKRAMYAISARNVIESTLRDMDAAEPVYIDTYELLPDAELIRIAKQQVEWATQRPDAIDLMRAEGKAHEFLCRAEAALRVLILRYK